ncbi:MAG: glycogen/starch synthase, starch synthase [Berkelbacteria bacterium GW2011_GWE1_39_12]|uniref:Glycogen synthase n=1 Tax=Berkelbacteria bacterium GW2011_GWE1_39_12 TaxID=1618337 RepID=A0A0G4B3C6_9BACT|nr:MAG: glycogen/starch synthase, starch synthase [Berkelbacteria bacterium GW2011_GWE1_39_12]
MKKKFPGNMKILHITTELTPLAKAGGLGDIVGYLPKAMANEFPVDIKIMMACYKTIDLKKYNAELIIEDLKIELPDGKKKIKVSVWKTYLPNTEIPVYLIDFDNFFSPKDDGIYLSNIATSYEDVPYFLYNLISKITLDLVKIMDWYPDVIHYHDSFEALTSKWLNIKYQKHSSYRKIATVMTIHNLATQPKFRLTAATKLGFKRKDFSRVNKILKTKVINLTAEAIDNVDMMNTVSPTYAKEVLSKKYGAGLNKLLKMHKKQFTGIVNGIDYTDFDPRTNKDTPVNYGTTSLYKKVENKLYLQKKLGLTQSAELPLICAVTRIVGQKGVDLMEDVLKDLVDMGAQFVILGSGYGRELEKIFIKAEKENPKEIAAEIGFDANFAQTIYAGADMLLMPSRYEPCGLSQIIAMRFGTVPIVRKTGGLADTVKDGKTGFVFKEYDKNAFLWSIRRAVDLYYNDKEAWQKMQVNCMKEDFSWEKSAKKYMWLYRKAVSNHKNYLNGLK